MVLQLGLLSNFPVNPGDFVGCAEQQQQEEDEEEEEATFSGKKLRRDCARKPRESCNGFVCSLSPPICRLLRTELN